MHTSCGICTAFTFVPSFSYAHSEHVPMLATDAIGKKYAGASGDRSSNTMEASRETAATILLGTWATVASTTTRSASRGGGAAESNRTRSKRMGGVRVGTRGSRMQYFRCCALRKNGRNSHPPEGDQLAQPCHSKGFLRISDVCRLMFENTSRGVTLIEGATYAERGARAQTVFPPLVLPVSNVR